MRRKRQQLCCAAEAYDAQEKPQVSESIRRLRTERLNNILSKEARFRKRAEVKKV
jgi:hypothetical protein